MKTHNRHRPGAHNWLLLSLIVLLGTAAAQASSSGSGSKDAKPVAPAMAETPAMADRKASMDAGVSLLGPAEVFTATLLDSQGRTVKLESTNTKGDCPSGATKIESCSGVYPNGNSWSIAPCCRTVTE